MALTIKHTFVSTKPDGNDSTLIRPSNWNADHQITGTLAETDLTLADNTTNNATTGRHGFLKKLPNDSNLFMDGTGNWTAPSGGDSFFTAFTENGIYTTTQVSFGDQIANFPVSIFGAAQGTYGKISLNITSEESETGIQIANDTDDGRTFVILSTGTGSGVGSGKLLIGGQSSQNYLTILENGNIGINDLTPDHQLVVNGDTRINGRAMLGDEPICDNALVTVYQLTMDGTANTSMMDMVLNAGGFSGNATALNVHMNTSGNLDGAIGIYVRNNINGGNIGMAAGILIDAPGTGESAVSTQYGLLINNQNNDQNAGAINIYSAGATSSNLFEGQVTFGTTSPYTFPTADGTIGQVLTTSGAGQVSWADAEVPPITNQNGIRMLADFTDPNFNGPKLRIFRFAGSYQNSSVSRDTQWFTPPNLPISDTQNMDSAGQSIRFYAYWSMSNTTLNQSTSGITKGTIEHISSTTAIEVSSDSTPGVLSLGNAFGAGLVFKFMGIWDHADTQLTITIHYVGEAFTSPEWWC